MGLSIADIEQLFAERGDEQYAGEPVTQLQHALQCALRAEQEAGDDALVTAALLHDLGHLLHDFGATPTLQGVDDLHQYRALPFLRGLFDARVLEPIRFHVDAKRYLCATRPAYYAALSEDSKRSLVLQGGVFDAQQAREFLQRPGAAEAVRVRVWDDLAKVDGLATPPLSHYLDRARACVLAA
ncbi:MAG TPA: phosphonate degradation HD-domain oxygenase [Ramlibacter sp.]|jgi:phosphonate degradation associated HDIG domain protein